MMTYERGDKVLLQFPFTTLVREKQRPAVIVSTDIYNQTGDDVIAAAITGNLKAARRPGDYLYPVGSRTYKEILGQKYSLYSREIINYSKVREDEGNRYGGIWQDLKEALGLKT